MRLRHRHCLNHRLAYVLFALSLQHYSSIMRRILLVYMLYLSVYFILFDRYMQLRLYRRLRARSAYLRAAREGARSGFDWAGWLLLSGWLRHELAAAVSGAGQLVWLQHIVARRVHALV